MGGIVCGRWSSVGGKVKWGAETSEQVEGAHAPFAEHVVTQLNRRTLSLLPSRSLARPPPHPIPAHRPPA
jgi:hypothetical protein